MHMKVPHASMLQWYPPGFHKKIRLDTFLTVLIQTILQILYKTNKDPKLNTLEQLKKTPQNAKNEILNDEIKYNHIYYIMSSYNRTPPQTPRTHLQHLKPWIT